MDVVIGVRAEHILTHIMSVSSCRICSATFIYWDTGKLDEPRRVRAQSGWFRVGGGEEDSEVEGGRKKDHLEGKRFI